MTTNPRVLHSKAVPIAASGVSTVPRRKYISLAAAAKLIDVSAPTLSRAARLGTLRAFKVGKTWLTTEEAAKEWKQSDVHKPGRKARTDT